YSSFLPLCRLVSMWLMVLRLSRMKGLTRVPGASRDWSFELVPLGVDLEAMAPGFLARSPRRTTNAVRRAAHPTESGGHCGQCHYQWSSGVSPSESHNNSSDRLFQ